MINILTRTSNRPKGFDFNRQIVKSQTYKNIKHIVSYDNEQTKLYLDNYDDIVTIPVNRELLIKQDKSLIPGITWRLPHNLYFNELHKHVDEGWVVFLDDDDSYVDEHVVQTIVDNLPDEDDILVWQMIMPNNIIIPSNMVFENSQIPSINNIGTPCFAVHSKHLSNVYWDGWRAADFRFFDRVVNVTSKVHLLQKVLVSVTQIGMGQQTDIK